MKKIIIGSLVLASISLFSCAAETGQQQADVSAADQMAHQGALELKDLSFCEKIKDPDYRNQCTVEVQDENNHERATAENDVKFCEMLSTRDKQDACKIELEIANALTQQHTSKLEEIQLANGIVNSGDYDACTKLTDEDIRTGCRTNIIYARAVHEKNYALCDKIADLSLRQSCHQLEQMNKPLDQQGLR